MCTGQDLVCSRLAWNTYVANKEFEHLFVCMLCREQTLNFVCVRQALCQLNYIPYSAFCVVFLLWCLFFLLYLAA